MSGIAIKVKSNFNRVLSDLSFIPNVRHDDLIYAGRYRRSDAELKKNIAPFSKLDATVSGSRYSIDDNKMIIASTYEVEDVNNNVGVRFNLEKMPENVNISTVFHSMMLPPLTNYKVWPIASVWANSPSGSTRFYPGLFCIGIWQDEKGQKKIVMRYGTLQPSEQNNDFASIPFDFTGSDAVYVTASKSANGNAVMTAIINGVSHSIEHKFETVVFPQKTTEPRFYFGTVAQRPWSGSILSGSGWSGALDMAEVEEANYRQYIVCR